MLFSIIFVTIVLILVNGCATDGKWETTCPNGSPDCKGGGTKCSSAGCQVNFPINANNTYSFCSCRKFKKYSEESGNNSPSGPMEQDRGSGSYILTFINQSSYNAVVTVTPPPNPGLFPIPPGGKATVRGQSELNFDVFRTWDVDIRRQGNTVYITDKGSASNTGGYTSSSGQSGTNNLNHQQQHNDEGPTSDSVFKVPTLQERLDEIKAEDERLYQEMVKRFEAYEKSLSTGASTITNPPGNQNIGNPHVNQIATSNGVVIPASPRQPNTDGRGQGAGAQRVGGNTNKNRPVTGRTDQSANPNAVNNTESRAHGAQGSLPYTERQELTPASSQQPKEANPVRAATTSTLQIQADTIAAYTPSRPLNNTTSSGSSQSSTSRPRSNFTPTSKPESSINIGGYKFKDEAVRRSCDTLSSAGKQILSAIDEVAKELNVTIWITDGNRTWEDQLSFLLERPDSYSGITGRFVKEFEIEPPKTITELTDKQKEWYRQEIITQAGTGFRHVGGNAIDIRVSDFSINGKKRLDELLSSKGIKILYEIPPKYDVPRNDATVFHLYK